MAQQGSAQWFFPLVELLLPASRSGTPESDLRDAWPGHRAQRGILFGGGWEELGYGSYGSAGSGQSYFFSRTSPMLGPDCSISLSRSCRRKQNSEPFKIIYFPFFTEILCEYVEN